MKKALTVAFAILLTAAFTQPLAAHDTAGTVKVTVNYKGKGKVDASHKLWVYLFDTPDIGPGSMPIDMTAIEKNGADAVFENVAGDKVYIAVAFDESGSMMGDGPPPTGSPVGILSGTDGVPSPVTPGAAKGAVLNFDDTNRMP